MAYESQYSDTMLDSMQAAYGEGWLSPGAAEEVAAILEGVTVAGREVVDLGCGVGGAAILMAGEMGARHVLGVDVEAHTLERTARAVAAAGLADRITIRHVEPGPLPLDDASADIVYTNDVICHVPDKLALFADLYRVLRPGGVFAGGDWTVGSGGPERAVFDDWNRQLHAGGLRFWFEPVGAYSAALEAAGFEVISERNNSAWAERVARAQLEHALGPAREASIAALGEAAYKKRTLMTRTRCDALANGSANHWLLQARKPD